MEGRLTRSVLIPLPVGQSFQKPAHTAQFPGELQHPASPVGVASWGTLPAAGQGQLAGAGSWEVLGILVIF